MKRLLLALLAGPLLAWAQVPQSDVRTELRNLAWQMGPTRGAVADKAIIDVPQDYVFLGEKDTRRFIQLMGNPPVSNHYLIAPHDLHWFAVFSFEPTGYIRDDEKIDADDLLRKLKAGGSAGNEERKRVGAPALYTDGWQVTPHYDAETKRLEWGVRLRDEKGQFNVNYTSRILGRTGVMSAILVSDVDALPTDTREFKIALTRFAYNDGEKYTQFKDGDKIAQYGLAALVLGGAAAVATKKGFWAVLGGFLAASWKLVIGAVVALFAGIGSIFKKKQ